MEKSDRDPLTEIIIGAGIEVHRELGQGLLESAYKTCLAHELQLGGVNVRMEVEMPIIYKGLQLKKAYRMDLVVEENVVVELKAVDRSHDSHEAQILTHLRFSGLKIGLLMNFYVPMLKYGIRRYAN